MRAALVMPSSTMVSRKRSTHTRSSTYTAFATPHPSRNCAKTTEYLLHSDMHTSPTRCLNKLSLKIRSFCSKSKVGSRISPTGGYSKLQAEKSSPDCAPVELSICRAWSDQTCFGGQACLTAADCHFRGRRRLALNLDEKRDVSHPLP